MRGRSAPLRIASTSTWESAPGSEQYRAVITSQPRTLVRWKALAAVVAPTASSSRQTLPGQAWTSPRASGVTALPIEMPSRTKASVRIQVGMASGKPERAAAATASMEPVSHGAGAPT